MRPQQAVDRSLLTLWALALLMAAAGFAPAPPSSPRRGDCWALGSWQAEGKGMAVTFHADGRYEERCGYPRDVVTGVGVWRRREGAPRDAVEVLWWYPARPEAAYPLRFGRRGADGLRLDSVPGWDDWTWRRTRAGREEEEGGER